MGFYTGKNVLVTGAAGITGHAAVKRLLNEGAYVRATVFSNRKLGIEHPNLEVVQCDLMQHEDCMKVFANKYKLRGNQELYKINLDTLKNIVFDCAILNDTSINKNALHFYLLNLTLIKKSLIFLLMKTANMNLIHKK